MFGWEFPPHRAGGLATATLGLVKGLVRTGVDVTLAVPFDPAEDAPFPGLRLVGGARGSLRRRPMASPVGAYDSARTYGSTLLRRSTGAETAVYGPDLFAEVARLGDVAGDIAAEEPHDVIDAHDWLTFEAASRARSVSGKPLVVHIHATEFDRSGEGADPEICRRERDGLLAADYVISNSRTLRRQVVERYGVPPERVAAIHWGIDDQEWLAEPEPAGGGPLPAGDPIVLFLGRVTRQKGPDYFVEMARRVADHVPRARFVMAGEGDMLPRLIERTVEFGLQERFHFAGALDRADVDRAYRMAAVCVMPSVAEPFGLVALESLRRGTPCIVPRDSGAAEVLRNALRADFWDIEDMASKVVSILRYGVLHAELRERGHEELMEPRFRLEEPARRTAAVYRLAVAGARAETPRR